ncbi:secreted protein [Beggiatoa sp. PS]|nr:secreted protein [Beggiatoa sp. PS]
MSLKIPKDTTKQKPPTHQSSPSKPKKSSSMGWIFAFSIVVVIALAVVFFAKPEWFESLKQPGVTAPSSNEYEQFLTRLKEIGWTKSTSEKTVMDCPVPDSPTNSAMISAECDELRQLINESEIEQALNDLNNVDVDDKLSKLAVSLLFVPSQFVSEQGGGQISRVYLEKNLTTFDNASFDNIVKTRKTLRDIFAAFQKVVPQNFKVLEEKCRLDSTEYPALSFACQVASISHEARNVPVQKSEDILPFFNQDDVVKAKFLKQIADEAKDKVIEIRDGASVLETFCLISLKQEQIESGIAYELQKIGDTDFKEMTEAVKSFMNKNLQCAM